MDEIERFAWYDSWLARGGQPGRGAYEKLKMQGVSLVINLRERDERKIVENAGLRYVHIPVKNDRAPDYEQIGEWLELCRECSATDRLFVHCKGGEGRTSTFCAAVRLAQGYEVESAIAEQRRFDFEPDGKHEDQARFLRAFGSDVAAGAVRIPAL